MPDITLGELCESNHIFRYVSYSAMMFLNVYFNQFQCLKCAKKCEFLFKKKLLFEFLIHELTGLHINTM